MAAEKGIIIDYDWCTGCHSCEMACQMEHGFPIGQSGVKVFEVGPWQIDGSKKWQYDYMPVFTDMCNLCASRTEEGKLPTCVQHCQADCMRYGDLSELHGALADHKKQVLYAL